jgi:anti-anti-sigma factor
MDVDGPTVILRLAGRMGFVGQHAARTALADAASRSRYVRLDLREVDYMSSAGVSVLRDAAATIHESGGTLALAGVSEPVSVALKLAGEIPHLQLAIHN